MAGLVSGGDGRLSGWIRSFRIASARAKSIVLRFRFLLAALVLVAVAAAVGLETGIDRLWHRWQFAYNHGLLVVPMALWLLLVGLRGATIPRVGPSVVGMVAVAAAVAVYALTEMLDFTLGMQMMLPAILFTVVAALAGLHFAKYAIIPVGFVYFAIPVWDLANRVLQDLSTWMVSLMVRSTGLVAHIDAYYITIPSGTFEIAEGCSGLRYVVVSLALAGFYAMSWLGQWRNRFLLLAVAGIASIVANWVRIYSLVVIGHWTQMEHYLIAVSHDEHGWVVLFLFLAPVLGFARWLEGRERRPSTPPTPATVKHVTTPAAFLVSGAVVAALVISPVGLRGGAEAPSEPEELSIAGELTADWSAASTSGRWEPAYHAPHQVLREAYVSDNAGELDAFVARYLSQQPDSKLIASQNAVAPGWRISDSRSREVAVASEQRTVREMHLSAGHSQRVVWNWYLVGGAPAHGETRAKLLEIPALLQGRRDGSVIAVSTQCADDCDQASTVLEEFLASNGAALEAIATGRADE